MSEKKRYYWLKLKDDFFTQKEIKRLRKIAGGDTYTIIYLKLMLLSLKDEGNLFFENVEEEFIEELALELDEQRDDVEVTINYLKSKGLLNVISEDTMMLNRIPELIGSEGASAERVRNHRNKQKLLHCNTDVTESNALVTKCNGDIYIDIDKELDLDKDIKKKKDNYKVYGEFENVKLTDEEYEKIKQQNLLEFIDRLSTYLSSTGKKYKSHYATILTWARKENHGTSKQVPKKYTKGFIG